ncbi:hypothetical protein SUGI_0853070 [Cryptomeria japonica]|uniref:uncharacterized protein LOC131047800 isoform X2 n=1 Tax=Cryptomeria japonica TaxID=3369 RepID=UPI00241498C2|nr:uncharacterized protein LOC131047800 isoform X2 [Cryptomeria japonica]GLJ41208.1 hypothetical protein SUGI_0853070 [Cryptomeria japonica]
MAVGAQSNSTKFSMIFVLLCTLQVHGSDSGLIQLKSFLKSRESIGNLPASSQKFMLKIIGEEYAKQNMTSCNVFGGVGSCASISDFSNYMKSCNSKGKLIDCAFQIDTLQTTLGDPSFILQQYIGDSDHVDCAYSHEKSEKFLCAITTPSCGTVDKVLDEIPSLISSVASKKSSPSVSLQKAVPRIIQAASLGFPCKMMCEAVVEAYGCSQPTFGEVMDAIEVGSQSSARAAMGLSKKELFHFLWDKQVCDIFSEDSVPGFSGVCVLSLDSTAKCNLCNGLKEISSIPKEVLKHGVQKLSQMVLRLLQGGLEEVLLELDDNKKAVNSYVDQANERKMGRQPGTVVIVVIFMAFLICTFVASIRLSRNRLVAYQYVDLSRMGYTPPML